MKTNPSSIPPWMSFRTLCATRLLALLLLLLALPAGLQAQFNYGTNDDGTITITGYTGPGGTVAIPDTITGLPVTSIGDDAFERCTSLTSVTLPDSVTNIGQSAFRECTSLTNVTIGNGVTNIGWYAFMYCSSLTSITIPDSVTNIGMYAFEWCTSLTSVTIPNSVTTIASGAFAVCTSLTNAVIGNSVKSIEGDPGAFALCTNLTSIVIPDSVTTIGTGAFAECTSLTNVVIGNSVTDLSGFNDCTGLTSITIPASVNTIWPTAFARCSGLTSVAIPDSVIRVAGGEKGFWGWIPGAFADCTSLTNVTIPASVASIGVGAFYGCSSLKAFTVVDAVNPVYSSVDGVLFNKNQTTLIQCPPGKTGNYTVPNSVTRILGLGEPTQDFTRWKSSGAFADCTGLTSVTIPKGVTYISDGSFVNCTNLTAVYFEGNAPALPPPDDLFLGVFVADDWSSLNATVSAYYLPGTTGWGPTYGELPTALWYPRVGIAGANFGVRTNRFGFDIAWGTDRVVVVEACPSLTNPTWSPVATNTLTDGLSYFSDPQWTNYPARFYRLRSP